MADGTKSSDHEVAGKKKRAQRSEKKSATKRGSAVDKSMRSEKSGQKAKKTGKSGTKHSEEDDLDIESQDEASGV